MNILDEISFLLAGYRYRIVCRECKRDEDSIVGPAGDYGLCERERCNEPVTSKTGFTILEKTNATPRP